jgi:hypothetical protein
MRTGDAFITPPDQQVMGQYAEALVVCGVNKLNVLIREQIFSSFGIYMVDVYSLTAPTIARKEAAQMAREANEKR